MGSPISLALAVYVSMLLASIENALALPFCQTNIESETGKQPFSICLFQVISRKIIDSNVQVLNEINKILNR